MMSKVTRGFQSTDLVILTYDFPFGNRETFIEPEIDILATCFRRILVLPVRSLWRDIFKAGCRPLPKNVSIVRHRRIVNPNVWIDTLRVLAKADMQGRAGVPYAAQWRQALVESIKVAKIVSLLSSHPDIALGSQLFYSYWKAEPAAALAFLRRNGNLCEFVTRCHGMDLYDERLPLRYRPFERLIAAEAARYLPISEHGARYLKHQGVYKGKIICSRLGVRPAVRRADASRDGILRIVSCSDLLPLKRVGLLAQALQRFDHPFEWTHFGDGPERSDIEHTVRSFPRHGRANLKGRLPNQEVLNHYTHNPVDIFVNVSTTEGIPVSIMEALAHGIPCLATDVGGSREIVSEVNGSLLPAAVTPERLQNALKEPVKEPQKWRRKREQALAAWRERCDGRIVFKAFAEQLQSIVPGGSC